MGVTSAHGSGRPREWAHSLIFRVCVIYWLWSPHNRWAVSLGGSIGTAFRIGKRLLAICGEAARGFRPAYRIAYRVSAILPPFVGATLRASAYRWAGFQIGRGVGLHGPLEIVSGSSGFERRLIIGPDAVIAMHVTMNVDDLIRIDDNVSIGPFVKIYTGTHAIGNGSQRMMRTVLTRPVVIERGAWVGLGAVILPGVTIGQGSIVGAGSVVTKDVPRDTYVEGNPATVVRKLPWGNR